MAKTSYLVLKSPHEQSPSKMISRLSSKEESTIILVEDGVYHAILGEACEEIKRCANEILVSREDLLARGFSDADLKCGKAVEYGEIVDSIMELTERTVTL